MVRVLVQIKFKDRKGENKGRQESFLVSEDTFWKIWDDLKQKFEASAHWIRPHDRVLSEDYVRGIYING